MSVELLNQITLLALSVAILVQVLTFQKRVWRGGLTIRGLA